MPAKIAQNSTKTLHVTQLSHSPSPVVGGFLRPNEWLIDFDGVTFSSANGAANADGVIVSWAPFAESGLPDDGNDHPYIGDVEVTVTVPPGNLGAATLQIASTDDNQSGAFDVGTLEIEVVCMTGTISVVNKFSD
jgi:hypothetical protein